MAPHLRPIFSPSVSTLSQDGDAGIHRFQCFRAHPDGNYGRGGRFVEWKGGESGASRGVRFVRVELMLASTDDSGGPNTQLLRQNQRAEAMSM